MYYVPYGITCSSIWSVGITSHPVLIDMSPGGSTLRGGSGATYGVASGLSTLRSGVGSSYCSGFLVVGGVACGGLPMLKISTIYFKACVWFLPSVVIGIVGVGLRRMVLRSSTAWVSASFDNIVGKGRLVGNNSVVSETCPFAVLVVYYGRHS